MALNNNIGVYTRIHRDTIANNSIVTDDSNISTLNYADPLEIQVTLGTVALVVSENVVSSLVVLTPDSPPPAAGFGVTLPLTATNGDVLKVANLTSEIATVNSGVAVNTNEVATFVRVNDIWLNSVV